MSLQPWKGDGSETTIQGLQLSSCPPPSRIIYEPERTAGEGNCNSSGGGTVLMLHGWAQNTTVFAQRTKKLTKRLIKHGYRVVLLQAPHRLPPKAIETSRDQQQPTSMSTEAPDTSRSREFAYAWFLYDNENEDENEDENYHATYSDKNPRPSSTGTYRGMKESLDVVYREIVNEIGNYNSIDQNVDESDDKNDDSDAEDQPSRTSQSKLTAPIFVLGFSQGAVMVHKIATLVCDERERRRQQQQQLHCNLINDCCSFPSGWIYVTKCILISGFPYRAVDCCRLMDSCNNSSSRSTDRGERGTFDEDNDRLQIPSLHVMGYNDIRVRPELSFQLAHQCGFVDPKSWQHDRGHIIPQDFAFCQCVIDFLTDKRRGDGVLY